MPLLRVAAAALGGLAVGAAFEPVGWAYLLPFAVAVLVLVVRDVRWSTAFLLGTVFGTAFMLFLLPWLRVIGGDAWLALSLFQGLFYGLLAVATAVVQRLRWWPVWGASLWVMVEMLRGTVPFGGFPWGRLAFATVDTPVAPWAAYIGAAGATLGVALVGTALAWAVLEVRSRPVRGVAGLGAACLLVGTGAVLPLHAPEPAEDRPVMTVAAVQGDVPGVGMDAFSERRAVLDNHVSATLRLAQAVEAGEVARPDLVVWPENSTDIDPFSDAGVHADIQAAVDAVGVPVLVGAMVGGADPSEVYNQGIVWHPGAGPGQRYAKKHPVPFGEYIPFRDVFAPYISRLDQIPRDMTPGTEPGLLDVAGRTVGDLICFEIAYDDLVREVARGGAQMLVVQTNNATYMGTGQVEQQFAISRLRAIETGLPVVVAATNGVTGFVAPQGEVVERARVRTQEVLVHRVVTPEQPAPGIRGGVWFERGVVLVAAVATWVGIVVDRRRRRATQAQPEVRATIGTA